MAINLSNVITEINTRSDNIDSNTSLLEMYRINAARDRLNTSGAGVLTYRSTGHLPPITDSAYVGSIAYVASDNVFGDSSGAFYFGTGRDSGWVQLTLTQDSDEADIEVPTISSPGYLTFQGASYGYGIGGRGGNPDSRFNKIEKYSFTSDGNSTDVGDLSLSPADRAGVAGGKSSTKGYAMGGGQNGPAITTNHIESFPFASDGNAADIGYDMLTAFNAGQASTAGDRDYVYRAGGGNAPLTAQNNIEKFQSSAEANSTDVGDLVVAQYENAVTSSDTVGYKFGGHPGSSVAITAIDTWPFATDENATDAGDLHTATLSSAGHSSATHGYSSGGWDGSVINNIQKFPFASFTTGTDVGDLLVAAYVNGGTSAQTHGYKEGGWPTNSIEKFSYTTDGNATDVGDMSSTPHYRHGNADY